MRGRGYSNTDPSGAMTVVLTTHCLSYATSCWVKVVARRFRYVREFPMVDRTASASRLRGLPASAKRSSCVKLAKGERSATRFPSRDSSCKFSELARGLRSVMRF